MGGGADCLRGALVQICPAINRGSDLNIEWIPIVPVVSSEANGQTRRPFVLHCKPRSLLPVKSPIRTRAIDPETPGPPEHFSCSS